MPKRFIDTKLWGEDWFLDAPSECKLFWYYAISNCDHAGILKVNLGLFSRLVGVKVTSTEALSVLNYQKERIRVVNESTWFIEDFFVYQYGPTLNLNNKVHDSIFSQLKKHNIDPFSIRGLRDLKERTKDKDKDTDTVLNTGETIEKTKSKTNEPINFNAQAGDSIANRVAKGKAEVGLS